MPALMIFCMLSVAACTAIAGEAELEAAGPFIFVEGAVEQQAAPVASLLER
jgi:hypothetical protein